MVMTAQEFVLLARLVAHDTAALAELYDQYSPVVYACAVRLCAAEAEEITLDAFLALWRHPEAILAVCGSVRVWLLGQVIRSYGDRTAASCREQGSSAPSGGS